MNSEGATTARRLGGTLAYDLLPDAVIVTDGAGVILYANPAAAVLLRRTRDALTGLPAARWLDGTGARATPRPLFARDFAGRRQVRSAEGDSSPVDVAARDVELSDGGRGLLLTLRPTDGTSAAFLPASEVDETLIEALGRNEERFAYATTVGQVGLFEHPLAPEPPALPWWSASLRTLLGVDARHPVDFEWFQGRIHPDDRGILLAAIEAANSPSGDGRVVAEYRWLHPERGYRWLLARSATVVEHEEGGPVPVRSIGAIIDVTEQRAAEEDRQRRAAILEATPDFVAITDLDGQLIDLNRSARRLMGLAEGEALAAFNVSTLHTPASALQLARDVIPTAKRVGFWSGETEYQTRDRATVPVSQVVLAHRDAAGRLAYLSMTARDLTRERQLEEQFRQAQKMEAIGRLAGGVAHDFNNMLSVVMGYAELATATLETGHAARDALKEILRAGERAAALTRQLLAFGRRQILQPKILDVNDVLLEFLPMVRRLVDERVDVQVSPAKEPVKVKADPNQLQQVLLNLAVNARDAMPDGGVLSIEALTSTLEESRAATRLELPAGRYAVIAVSDTGHGMDQTTRARIFEPFFTTKGPHEGTGLGLSTVLGIVQQSGGNIWVYSEPGHGTTFKLYFPCTDEAISRAHPESSPAPVLLPQTGVVLVTEDDDQVRAMIASVLARAGFEVLSAARPQEALELARRRDGPIALLLTDVVMPGMSGAALAEKLRETRRGLPVLFTSGYTENTIVHRGVLDEGVDFLPKPVTPGRLLTAVSEVLRRSPGG